MTKDEITYTSQPFRCRHCGNYAPFIIHTTCVHKHEEHDQDIGYVWESGMIYSILGCPHCSGITITSSHWHDNMESESELGYDVLYPSEEKMPVNVPEKIKEGYEAAVKVKQIDANAYAVLTRRLLELVCEDRKSEGKNLYEKLADLAHKNEIPDKLVEVANGLRGIGNIGAHAELGDVTVREVPIIGALINAILEYIYTAPYLAQLAKERLDELRLNKNCQQKKQ